MSDERPLSEERPLSGERPSSEERPLSEERPFRELVKEYGREMEAAITHHPPTEDLALYLDQMLDPEAMEAVANHLTFCRRCVTMLETLEQPMSLDDLPAPKQRSFKWPNWWPHLVWAPIAATLLVLLWLPSEPTEPAPARLAQPGFEQLGVDNARSFDEPLILKANQPGLVLQLNSPVAKTYARYELELLFPDGRTEVFREPQVLPGPKYSLWLPRATLIEGGYVLALKGYQVAGAGESLRVHRFLLEIE